eukprot:144934-Rhodomonas_salina.1
MQKEPVEKRAELTSYSTRITPGTRSITHCAHLSRKYASGLRLNSTPPLEKLLELFVLALSSRVSSYRWRGTEPWSTTVWEVEGSIGAQYYYWQ